MTELAFSKEPGSFNQNLSVWPPILMEKNIYICIFLWNLTAYSTMKQQHERNDKTDALTDKMMAERGDGKSERERWEDTGLKPSVCFSGMTLYWNITETVCVGVLSLLVRLCTLTVALRAQDEETVRERRDTEDRKRKWIFYVSIMFLLEALLSRQTRLSVVSSNV